MNLNFKSGFIAVIVREIRRMQSRPVYLLYSVILPLVFIFFLATIFGSGVPRELPIAIYDADNTALSREIVRMIDATPSVRITARLNNFNEGKRLIHRKKIYSMVIIPSDFEKDVNKGMSPSIVGYFNNIYMLPATVSYTSVYSAVETVSNEIKVQAKIKSRKSVGKSKDTVPVRIDTHKLFNPYINYEYYLCSGFMPVIFQVFIVVLTIFVLGNELKTGSAGKWMETAGGNLLKALSGKLFPYLVIFFIIGFFMNSILFHYIKIPLRGDYNIIIASNIIFVLSNMAVGIFLTAIFSNLRYAVSIGASYTAIAFTFSGFTYPLSSMPVLIRYIGEGIPLTHYLRIFTDQALRGAPSYTAWPSFAALAIFLLLPLIVYHRWSVIIRDEKYWGRV